MADRNTVIRHELLHKLFEESIVVAIVCILFLLHFRSALVAIFTLPIGVLAAFIVMNYEAISANIMSLGGIAIAIGAMVDGAIVIVLIPDSWSNFDEKKIMIN